MSRTGCRLGCRSQALLACAVVCAWTAGPVGLHAQSARPHSSSSPASTQIALPAPALSGALLGLVTDAIGRPEANAVVEVRSSGLHGKVLHALTSAQGLFQLNNLAPGVYYVEVGKGARVAERRRVEVHATERALLLVNLPQLLRSAQFGAPAGAHPDQAFDWALRQATIWRPVLRLDDGTADEPPTAPATPVQGYVALTAGGGSGPFDVPMLSTAFRVDTPLFDESQVSLSGTVGTNGLGGGEDTRVQASFSSRNPGNSSRVSVAVRQIALPGLVSLPSLRVMSASYSDGVGLGSRVHLQYGALVNSVTLTNTVADFDPYLRAIVRVGTEGQLEYRAVSAVPPIHFLADSAEMPDPTPRVTLDRGRARLEQARHQEIQYSNSLTPDDTVTAAIFDEHFSRAAVDGAYSINGKATSAAEAEAAGSDLLPDLLNNMFVGDGGSYGGWGYRFVFEHRLSQNWRADLGFADGEVLAPAASSFGAELASALQATRAHAVTVKLSGITPLTHTKLICSYKALSRATATGLDLYDDGTDQSDSFLNLNLRQPLPRLISGGDRIEALVEIHNLLAQGYIPMLGSDGHTLYLVQSARSLRGGLTFNF